MKNIKYCVASVYVNCLGESTVSFYAYNKAYGLHLAPNKNDEDVLWHDTLEEAKKHIMNKNDGECVLSFHTDYIPKFKNK